MTAPFIAIATGGRDFTATSTLTTEIVEAIVGAVILFHGRARGFDEAAEWAARSADIPVCQVPALWGHEGKKSGPMRNARMLRMARDLGRELTLPVVLIAGPGGRGTADMVGRVTSSTSYRKDRLMGGGLRLRELDIVRVCGAKP